MRRIAGVDSVSSGAIADGIYAAACILDEWSIPYLVSQGVKDSKKTKKEDRARLFRLIRDRAVAWGVGIATVGEINRHGNTYADELAMSRAIANLNIAPDSVVVDGKSTIRFVELPQEAMVGGDAKVAQISAASIIAKHFHDLQMERLHKKYPQYGFISSAAHQTPEHVAAIREHGLIWGVHRNCARSVLIQQLSLLEA